MTEDTKKKTSLFLNIQGLDPDIKRDFKAWCAANSISMTAAISAFMRDVAAAHVNGKSKRGKKKETK